MEKKTIMIHLLFLLFKGSYYKKQEPHGPKLENLYERVGQEC